MRISTFVSTAMTWLTLNRCHNRREWLYEWYREFSLLVLVWKPAAARTEVDMQKLGQTNPRWRVNYSGPSSSFKQVNNGQCYINLENLPRARHVQQHLCFTVLIAARRCSSGMRAIFRNSCSRFEWSAKMGPLARRIKDWERDSWTNAALPEFARGKGKRWEESKALQWDAWQVVMVDAQVVVHLT